MGRFIILLREIFVTVFLDGTIILSIKIVYSVCTDFKFLNVQDLNVTRSDYTVQLYEL